MKSSFPVHFMLAAAVVISSCNSNKTAPENNRTDIIIDTDANNELDDQHALAYAFCNADVFNIKGVTINSTRMGGGIDGHYREAVRIAKLCEALDKVPIEKGAEGTFNNIAPHLNDSKYDGQDAVEFLIESSQEYTPENKLLVVAIGKLTNIALAVEKDSTLADRMKVLWLGSNYPDPGEYNLENDTSAINPVFLSDLDIEIALVGYGRDDGTAAVTVPIKTIERVMPGLGPEINDSIEGRNGGYYRNFGDYAVNLWQNMELYGDQEVRSLFDLAALVIVKEPSFSDKTLIPAPYWNEGRWDTLHNSSVGRVMYINFRSDSIINDFLGSLENPVPVE